ncbi:MAG: hypothetical protein AAF579_16930, partial [Cyanobacteria bacterium P01_C01_bin.118]
MPVTHRQNPIISHTQRWSALQSWVHTGTAVFLATGMAYGSFSILIPKPIKAAPLDVSAKTTEIYTPTPPAIATALSSEAGLPNEAFLQTALDITNQLESSSIKLYMLPQIALGYGLLDDSDRSGELLRQAIRLAKQDPDPGKRAANHKDIARVYGQLNRNDSAQSILDSARTTTMLMDDSNQKASLLADLALLSHQYGNEDWTQRVLQEAMAIATKLDFSREKGYTLAKIAAVYHQLGNNNRTLSTLEEALKPAPVVAPQPRDPALDYEPIDTSDEQSRLFSQLASQIGELEPAPQTTALLEILLSEAEQINQSEARTVALLYGAIAALQLGDINWHQRIVEQALIEFRPFSYWSVALAIDDLIQIATKLNNSEHTQVALESALEIVDQSAESDWDFISVWQDVAKIYGDLGQQELAQSLLDKTLTLTNELDIPWRKAISLSKLAVAYQRIDPNRTQDLLQQALTISNTITDHQDRPKTIEAIVDAATYLDPADQLAILEQVRNSTDSISYGVSKAAALSTLADSYNNLGESAIAQSLLMEALNLAAPYYTSIPGPPPQPDSNMPSVRSIPPTP